MKKILSFFAVAAMLSMSFACTKVEDGPKGEDPVDPTPTVTNIDEFTATLSGAGIKTVWAEGDAVKVFAVTENGDVEAKYVLTSGAGSATATFKVEGTALSSGASAYFACYPYSSIDFAQHNTFSYSLEASQTAANPIFGTTTDAKTFTFATPLAGIEIKLTGKGNAARIEIEDKNTNNALNGNVTFNAKTAKFNIKNGSASKNSVAKAFETVALSSSATSIFVEVPAGTIETGASVIVYNPANGMIGKAEIPAQNLEAGTLTSIDVELEEISSVADLSATESANCYMITEPGTYKFKTNKGNGLDNVGVPASAVILWETYCNNEEVIANSVIAEVSYANDYVTFKTPETLKKGNAVIAVKDAEGVILWSWHIWVVADMVIEGSTYGFEGSGELMNYNLGAVGELGTAQSQGLIYAWGRKDPFVSAGDYADSTPATVSGIASTNTETQALVSSEFVDQNPTVWVLVTGSSGMKTWITPSDDTRWGKTKTIYDPCPAGWRVPDTDEHGFFDVTTQTMNEEETILTLSKELSLPVTYWKKYTDGALSKDSKYFSCNGSGELAYAWYPGRNKTEYRRMAEGLSIRCIKDVTTEE